VRPISHLTAVLITMPVLADTAQADSATQYNPITDHYYQLVETSQSWDAARKACSDLKGYLATITSKLENDWIQTHLTKGVENVWLGGTDSAKEGVWEWITGEPWNYTNWNPGEPNDFCCNGEDSLSLRGTESGKWNDLNSTSPYYTPVYYLCEWEATQYLDIATIPDVNLDGVSDQVLLEAVGLPYQPLAKHYLQIISGANGLKPKPVDLGYFLRDEHSAIAVMDDINGNGYKEISIRVKNRDGASILQLRDSRTGALIKTFTIHK